MKDIIEFYTFNREFKIRLSKELRSFSLSKFQQYKITIDFLNSLNQSIYTINTTELEYLDLILSLNYFSNSCYNEYKSDTIIRLNTQDNYSNSFIYISLVNPVQEFPMELDDVISLQFFNSTNQGNKLKIYLEYTIDSLEELAYNLYLLIEDIPYLDELNEYNIRKMEENILG